MGPKLSSLDWHLKSFWHIWNQHPQICRNAKFQAKVQNPKFSTKNALFGLNFKCIVSREKLLNRNKKCLIWLYILRLGFRKTKRLLPARWNLSKQIFMQKQKNTKFGIKHFWVIYWLEFRRAIVTFDVSTNMSLSNVLCKTKDFQTWNQECIICVILGCKFEKLFPYLKSVPSNLSKCKVLCKNKNS